MEKILEPSLRFKEFNVIYKNYVLNDILDLLTDFESNGSFASVKENVNIYEEKNYAWYVRATDLENKTGLDKVKYVNVPTVDFFFSLNCKVSVYIPAGSFTCINNVQFDVFSIFDCFIPIL